MLMLTPRKWVGIPGVNKKTSGVMKNGIFIIVKSGQKSQTE